MQKIFPLTRKALSKMFNCPDCNKEVMPDHENLLDCPCGLMAAKES